MNKETQAKVRQILDADLHSPDRHRASFAQEPGALQRSRKQVGTNYLRRALSCRGSSG